MKKIILFLYFALVFLCCAENTEVQKDKQSKTDKTENVDQGTKEMVERIQQILQSANKAESIYENEIRAEVYKQKFAKSQNGLDYFNYVKELLNDGKTDLAISSINDLFKNNPSLSTLTKQSSILHELLAVCYLRKGEQENCQENHNDESCIIPISKNGQHQKQFGSEKAIEKYKQLLSFNPNDTQSRWLLNIAYMTLGEYPEGVPKQYLIPIGTKLKNSPLKNVATQMGIDFFGLAGGSIAEDFNQDGFYDIITSSWGSQGQIKYYESDGAGSFVDKTNESGLEKLTGGLHINQTDYNNDGWIDVLVLRSAWMPQENWGILPNSLLRNNGDGTFSDVTIEAGIYSTNPTQAATWNDFNNDGWLDLFVANETTFSSTKNFPCEFYLNKGDGSFENVTDKYGMNQVGYFKGCTSGDVNNDGWQDIYLSNLDGDNLLYLGKNENGNFTGFELSDANIQKPKESFGCWFFDYDNDGWEDLYVASYDRTAFEDQGGQFANNLLSLPVKTENSCLYKNMGNGSFKNVTETTINEKGTSTMGCNFGDMNNDGYLDFYLATGAPDLRAVVPNRMYVNQGGKKFKDESFALGVGHIQKGHAVSFADFDNDGDQDIYAVMGGAFKGDGFPNAFFENSASDNSWLKIQLKGTKSNRYGIGARIRVQGNAQSGKEMTIYKTVSSGASFGANPFTAEIGLGQMTQITSVNINWPNGSTEAISYDNIGINKKYLIEEEGGVKDIPLKSVKLRKDKASGHHHHH